MVYKLDPSGNETILHSFTAGFDGASPYAGVVLDAAGNLYGTTAGGGSVGYGVVYKLDPSGNETVLYSFTGGSDGASPESAVILDSAGNIYGTTLNGGSARNGVVYKLDPSGDETVLHNFASTDGSYPVAGVILDSAGNLYGTTKFGGSAGYGVVYKLSTSGVETILHNFTSGSDGANPFAGVVLDSAGSLYGTTTAGGEAGGGVVYKIKGAVPRR